MREKIRRKYTAEFKAHAIEVVRSGRPVAELGRELNIGVDLIYSWLRESNTRLPGAQGAQIGSGGPTAGGEGAAADELRALRRRVARLELENDILKKAAIILGTPLQPKAVA